MKNVDPAEWKEKQLASHRPGMSAIIAPSVFSEYNFRWWAYLTVSLLSALIVSVTAYTWLSGPYTNANPFTLLLIAAFALSPPSFFYFNTTFPDLLAPLILTLIAALLWRPSSGRLIAVALLVIAAPWFTDRVVAPAAILGIGALFMTGSKNIRLSLLILFCVGSVALGVYYYQRYGVPYPINPDTRKDMMSISYIPTGIIKVLLDSGRGILFLAPVVVFSPAAFYRWWKSGQRRDLCLLAVAGTIMCVLPVAAYLPWRAGEGPAGRYSVVFLWMVLPAFIMWAKTGMTKREKIAVVIPLFLGFVQTLFLFDEPGSWRVPFHIMLTFPETHFFHVYLPWLYQPDTGEWLKAFYWGTGFLIYFIAGAWRTSKDEEQLAAVASASNPASRRSLP
jgi:hypothetical protein